MSEARTYLDRMQVLRCFAFLAIFLSHTRMPHIELLGLGAGGVVAFIMLSGFLLVYNHLGAAQRAADTHTHRAAGIKQNCQFAYSKLKKLYLLHLITMAAMLPLHYGEAIHAPAKFAVNLIANVFLVQEWLPLYRHEINPVGWYMCAIAFLYFCFPWILEHMEKKFTTGKAVWTIVICILLQVLIALVGSRLPTGTDDGSSWWTVAKLRYWFVYRLPLSRLPEFLIGCCTGYLFLQREHTREKRTYTLQELLALFFVVAANIVYLLLILVQQYESVNDEMKALATCVSYSLVFSPSTISHVASGETSIGNP